MCTHNYAHICVGISFPKKKPTLQHSQQGNIWMHIQQPAVGMPNLPRDTLGLAKTKQHIHVIYKNMKYIHIIDAIVYIISIYIYVCVCNIDTLLHTPTASTGCLSIIIPLKTTIERPGTSRKNLHLSMDLITPPGTMPLELGPGRHPGSEGRPANLTANLEGNTLPETKPASLPPENRVSQRKGSSSNHPFSSSMLVSGRVILNKTQLG